MTIRNEFEFRIHGMQRSGHHAIVVWIAHHFPPGSVHYINDVRHFHDPFTHHSDTASTTAGFECFVNRHESDIVKERSIPKQCLMYNYEDSILSDMKDRELIPQKLETIGASRREFTILVLRDPFNLLASRFRHLPRKQNWVGRTLDLWRAHAEEFEGLTRYLGPIVKINFDRWFSESEYRRNLSTDLGLDFTDAGLNRVPANAKGSSWDNLQLDGQAQNMKVLDRWRELENNPQFRKFFRGRDDVRELSRRIFGPMAGTERLFEEVG